MKIELSPQCGKSEGALQLLEQLNVSEEQCVRTAQNIPDAVVDEAQLQCAGPDAEGKCQLIGCLPGIRVCPSENQQ